jgi:hypothetical protein
MHYFHSREESAEILRRALQLMARKAKDAGRNRVSLSLRGPGSLQPNIAPAEKHIR